MAYFICDRQDRCCPHEFYDSIEQAITDSGDGVPCDHLIEVSPVRHGRWLKIEERMVLAYNTHFPMTITSETCSECNVRSGFLGKKGYVKDNCCPNCGCKMDLDG